MNFDVEGVCALGPETSGSTVADAVETMASAFADDPVLSWLLPPGAPRRTSRIRRYFELEIERWGMPRGATLVTPRAESVAIWYPPERPALTAGETVRALPAMLSILGRRTPLAVRGISQIEQMRPEEPHWYLHGLGTRPESQGSGHGALLVGAGIAVADRAGLGCYLEASAERNVPYYRGFGFEVTRSVRLVGDGPEVWAMWRTPETGH